MSDKSRLENNNLTLQNIVNTVTNLPDYIEIRNQNKTININGIYNADSGYTGLGTVTVNVSGGEGDVKQFDSIANMQADPNPTEGDLAIVYRNELEGIAEDSEFSSCIFPNTVVLDTAFSDDIYGSFRSVDQSIWFECWVEVSSSSFSLDGNGEISSVRVQYTSSDGITYTRTDGGEELVEFETSVKYEPYEPWNDAIGKFMKIDGMVFEGLYQYSNNSYSLAPTQFTADNRYVFDKSFYGVSGVDTGTLQNVENLTLDEVRLKAQVFSDLSYLTPSNNVTDMSNMFNGKSKLTTIPNLDTGSVTNMQYMFFGCYNLTNVPQYNTSNVTSIYGMFYECSNLTTVPKFNTINATNMGAMFSDCYNLTTVPNLDTSNVIGMDGMFQGCNNLTAVPNYNTSKVTDMSSMFFGCYNLTTVPNFNTSKVTDMSEMFPRCNALMNVPNFDTSKVTNMSGMFYDCNNLTNVPQYNTSNVTSMYGMFENCNNLTNVPNFDTSKVTDMMRMFYACKSLANVPQYNTSNVTSMYGMFGNCVNLTTVPNFDTSNVTDMHEMFSYCNSLVNVPQYNTSKVTFMVDMFCKCNNLSNESIQNIVNMCINSNVTNTTYKNLSNTNSYSIFSMSTINNSYYQNRWAELDAAGWTY